MVQHAEKESTAHGASLRLPVECFQHEAYELRRHRARPLREVQIDIGILASHITTVARRDLPQLNVLKALAGSHHMSEVPFPQCAF